MAHGAFDLRCSGVVPFCGLIVKFHGGEIGIYSAGSRHTHGTAIIQIRATM